jgi:hypothetical protein
MTRLSPQRRAAVEAKKYVAAAMRLAGTGRHFEAVAPLQRAAQLKPNDAVILNDIGVAYLASHRGPDAVPWLRRSLAVNPRVAGTHYNLGLALQESGDEDSALSSLVAGLARSTIVFGACAAMLGCGGTVVLEGEMDAMSDGPSLDASGGDGPHVGDAPSSDASGLDAPGLDAPGVDAPAVDSGCPSTPPHAGQCANPQLHCDYGSTQCECMFYGMLQGWNCSDCPTTEPENGKPCTLSSPDQEDLCSYGADRCRCRSSQDGAGMSWSCGTCPTAAPTNGTACTLPGSACTYGDAGLTCSCATEMWSCLLPCPATAPTPGDSCNIDPALECTYGSTTCTCTMNVVFCN